MKDPQRWAIRITAAVLLCVLAWWVSRPSGNATAFFSGDAFATTYHISISSGPESIDAVQQAVDRELARIDAMASSWRDDSELMRYNRAANQADFNLSDELRELIELAQAIEGQTGGAFSLRPDGGDIDLSGIAKGYAVDRVVELLWDEFGIKNCLIDIGGEVRGNGDRSLGDPTSRSGWRVGLYQPAKVAGAEAPVIVLLDSSVATSGSYFKGDHILDPATGEPVANDLVSASVVHPSNATADALATALYVMGSQRGMAWAEDNGVYAIFLLKDGTQLEHKPQ